MRARDRRCWIALAVAAVALLGTLRPTAAGEPAMPAPSAEPSPAAPLAERHARWLEDVDVILSAVEREAFLGLARDYQRDAFIERFWREHDTDRYTARNEFRERWEEKLAQVYELFGGPRNLRARHFLLHGPPDPRYLVYCRRREPQIEIWFYPEGSETERRPFPLWFFRPYGSQAAFRLREPGDEGLFATACEPGTLSLDEQDALRVAEELMRDWTPIQYLALLARVRDRPPAPDREWVATFLSLSTDPPPGAPPLPAALAIRYGGRRQSRIVVDGEIAVAADPEPSARHFLLNGEVLLDDRLFESFRVEYAPPAQPGPLALGFTRALRPGRYTLVVRVEEPGRGRFYRTETPLDVPAPPPPAALAATAEAAASAESAAAGEGLHLQVPSGILRGPVRFTAEVDGVVAAVDFLLDGKRILEKRAPPWSAELDLGLAARTHRVAAVARGAHGGELGRDERLVNAGDYRFAVRLLEPRPGAARRGAVHPRARAEILLPAGSTLERLDVFLDEARIGTLHDPPWELPLPRSSDAALHVLRVVAVLADGSAAEDSVVLNTPEGAAAASIEVRLVELFVRAHGRDRRPVHGLSCADFRLREDGVEQSLLRCEEATERTLHVGVLLDLSASMAERLADAKLAADHFLTAILRPKDRASLSAFNDFTHRLVPFTNDLAALRAGLDGLAAERGTALWDALVRTLQDFAGVEGRRAQLLLSDGLDRQSVSTFEEVRALARQSGVVLYAVGLDLPLGGPRHALRRLCEESGGRAFFVRHAGELDAVYAEIADQLGSQYLLAYQPQATGDAFRTVEIDARRPGVEVEAPAGYQP